MKFNFKKGANGSGSGSGTTTPEPESGHFTVEVENDDGAVESIERNIPKSSVGSSSSRFAFTSPFGKKSSPLPSSSVAPTPTPPSPSTSSSKKGEGSKKKRKKAPLPQLSDDDEDYNEGKTRKSKSSSSTSSSSSSSCCCCCCCSCSGILTWGFFLILGTVIGVLTWRYGPWAKDSFSSTVLSLEASSSCEDCCNGLQSNCDLTLDKVMFPMVRRAHSSYDNNFVGASNSRPFEEALVAGYRALQLSTCIVSFEASTGFWIPSSAPSHFFWSRNEVREPTECCPIGEERDVGVEGFEFGILQ